jgi:RNA polymerase sigma-70 factor (ECF subfamily)
MSTDADRIFETYLVSCARLGERKALGLLAIRWQKKLLVHAWRLLGDEEAARDAVQEGWAEILRGLPRLRDQDAFPAWAYRIVSRRCSKYIRRLQRRRELDSRLAAEPVETFADAGGDEGLDVERARAALRKLPAEQQAAVALFYLEEMSVAEVAVALDVPAGTVKTRLMHARRKLRAALEGEE